jgi:hypothetical protein
MTSNDSYACGGYCIASAGDEPDDVDEQS